MDDEIFHFICGILIGIVVSALVFGILTPVILDTHNVNSKTLDAICKDKINNTEFKEIDIDGNIVCKSLPEMQRLDHTNQFIYVDNKGDN